MHILSGRNKAFPAPFLHQLPLCLDSISQETFPQFLDVIYWFRQVLALVIGVVWGRAASRGGTAIMSFAALVRRLRKCT
jgi:hypothetical protein